MPTRRASSSASSARPPQMRTSVNALKAFPTMSRSPMATKISNASRQWSSASSIFPRPWSAVPIAEVLSAMGTADQGLGKMDEALDHWREAFEIFVAIGARDIVGNAFSALTDVLIWGGRADDALELARRVGMPELEEQVIRRQLLQGTPGAPEPRPTPPDPDAAARVLDDRAV